MTIEEFYAEFRDFAAEMKASFADHSVRLQHVAADVDEIKADMHYISKEVKALEIQASHAVTWRGLWLAISGAVGVAVGAVQLLARL